MTMSIVPMHPVIGAEIKGVDLTKPVDNETQAKIRKAFEDHVVVVFRGQDLSDADQVRAGQIFGKVVIRAKPAVGDLSNQGGEWDTPFMYVTNIVENGKPLGAFGDGEMWFHHDTSYYEEPHRATMLYSQKLTSSGGETCFANQYAAYDRIPRKLRDKLEGKKVLQVHDYKRRERLDVDTIDLGKVRNYSQPIFITHPSTGRKSLYVSRLMTARIEGMPKAESEEILAQLFDISEEPEIVYEHKWQVGDLVAWDNWCSTHMRKDFPREEPRLMRRITIEGRAMQF
jgi:taurine dioxygenase